MKMIRVTKKNPHILYFKMKYYQMEFSEIDLIQVGGKRGVKRDASRITPMKRAYGNRLLIAAAKYDDLMEMCREPIIPPEYQDYYKNLPVSLSVVSFSTPKNFFSGKFEPG